MVSFLAEVKIFRFWSKTMDYNKAFLMKSRSFFAVLLLLNGRCYEAEIPSLLPSPQIVVVLWATLREQHANDLAGVATGVDVGERYESRYQGNDEDLVGGTKPDQ